MPDAMTDQESPPSKKLKVENDVEIEEQLSVHEEEDDLDDDHCSICLQYFSDRAVIPDCSHEFCFECIITWTEQSRRCPLCTQTIGPYVIHNIRSNHDYQKFHLPPLRSSPPPIQPLIPRQRRLRRNRVQDREWGRRTRRTQEEADELERAIDRRRWVYQNNLYAKHVASNAFTRYRPFPSPTQFAASQDYISRATIFIRRELRVWVNLDVEFLTTFVLSLLKAIDIRSESAVKLMAEFLDMDTPYLEGDRYPNAEHFAHELYSFLRSPFKNLASYDAKVEYDEPKSNPFRIHDDGAHYEVSRRRRRNMSESPHSMSRSPRAYQEDIGSKHYNDRHISGSSRANLHNAKTRKASTRDNQRQNASSSSSGSRAVAIGEDDKASSGAVLSSTLEEEYGPKPASPKRSLVTTPGGRDEELLIDKLDRKGKRRMLPYDVRRGYTIEPFSTCEYEDSLWEDAVHSAEKSVSSGQSTFKRTEAAEAPKTGSGSFDQAGDNEKITTPSTFIDPFVNPTSGRQNVLKSSKPVRNSLSLVQAHLSRANERATSGSLSAAVANSTDISTRQWKHGPKPNLLSRITGPERMDSQSAVVDSSALAVSPPAPHPFDTSTTFSNDEISGNSRGAVRHSAVPATEIQKTRRSTNEVGSDDTKLRGSSSPFIRSRLLQRLEAEKDLHRAGLDTSSDAPVIGKYVEDLEAVETNLRMKARVRLRLAVEKQRNGNSRVGSEKEGRVDAPSIAYGPEHEIDIALSKEDQLKAALAKRRSTR